MISRKLLGTKLPYFLRAGDGEKYLFGGQLASMIAREQETARRLEAVILSGAKARGFPCIGTRSRMNRSSFFANPRTIVVLISSFPYAINWSQENRALKEARPRGHHVEPERSK
jgi:hypothetical protein